MRLFEEMILAIKSQVNPTVDLDGSFRGPTYFCRPTYFRDDIFPGPHDIRWFFGTWFFADGFLFPVKELGFWTNPGHWVRVLDAAGSYMYIVL
jgi:hypothetical protein